MTFAFAAAPSRLVASAFAAASILTFLFVGRADAAERSWSAYLAPAGVCGASDDVSAPAVVQVHAVSCLVNWARAQDGSALLVRRAALQRAATLKGQRVASCGQFSHTPCGAAFTAAVQTVGYEYEVFAENLFAGTWGQVSARDVVSAWLKSPSHRANILDRDFQHMGAAPVRADGLFDGADAVVWTANFASPL